MGAVVLLAGCSGRAETTYRYRMTVYVDTPSGPRSGSSVIEIETNPSGWLSSNTFQTTVRGEAVAVGLPSGTLFALLRSPASENAAQLYAGHAYRTALPYGYDWKTGVEVLKRQTEPANLPPEHYPKMVRFRDPRDARTVGPLEPSDLTAVFGTGTTINRIEIQITQDSVTRKLGDRLPSFGSESGFDAWIRQVPYGDPRLIYLTDFRKGL